MSIHAAQSPIWSKYLCLILTTVLLCGCKLQLLPTLTRSCPVMGCDSGLTLYYSGSIPGDYVLEAVTPEGKKMEVHCVDGVGQYPEGFFSQNSYPICRPSKVEFFHFSPAEVTITLKWGDDQVSQTFKPTYTSYYPNGPGCAPACPRGQITFAMP
jgi:hypothetical protein